MKFTETLTTLSQTNSYLKVLCFVLSLSIIAPSIAVLVVLNKPPLLVERSAGKTELLHTSKDTYSALEIKNFLKLAISERFDSNSLSSDLLSKKEKSNRDKEQKALQSKEISQRVFIDPESIVITKNTAILSTDRLLAVKNIRSALIFNLEVEFKKVKRTALNPYGLILTKVRENKSKNSVSNSPPKK